MINGTLTADSAIDKETVVGLSHPVSSFIMRPTGRWRRYIEKLIIPNLDRDSLILLHSGNFAV